MHLTESWNSWLDAYRAKLILALLEFIRRKVMKRMHKRLSEARKWNTELPLYVHRKLEAATKAGRHCRVISTSDIEFKVLKKGSKTFVADLEKKICDCRVCQVSELPCKHVLLCIAYVRHNVIEYVYEKLKKPAYVSTYDQSIKPLPD